MSNIIPIGQARRSTAMTARLKAGQGLNRNFADNVGDSFPKLSIKGKVFRIRIDGKETPLIDQQTRQPLQFLDVIMVNASRHLAKAFYTSGYEEGDFNPPDCWSLDSIRPDPSVVNKQSPTCVACPQNAFGSRVTPSGKGAKACSDSRRVAVVMPGHLDQDDPFVFLLKVPQASLKNMKAYSQLLDRQGFDVSGCVTRLSFDYSENVSFPKLVFTFVDGLDDDEFAKVTELAEGTKVESMLLAPDFEAEVSTEQPAQPTTGRAARQAAPAMGEQPATQAAEQTQAAPVTGRAQRQQPIAEGAMETAVAQAKADQAPKAVESTIIDLPDGQRFDTATGEYIERAPAKAEMPQIDPDVIALPDGKFFNKATNKFVASNVIGAAAATVEEPPRRRAPRKPAAKAEAGTGGTVSSAGGAVPPAEMKAPAAAETQANQTVDADDMNGVDDDEAGDANGADVQPAPRGLEELLKAALPTRKQ